MIYVASPYYNPSSEVIQERMEKIYKFIGEYIKLGIHVITPLFMHEVAVRHNLDGTYAFWDKYCLDLLKRCDKMIVLCLDGWKESRGVNAEIEFCEANNIPIEYIYF